ncbi:MAG: PIG-L family deacetylase [Rhodospirillales bacterium]|nr:PIG-L family deacetylase [Rhodospirillales bacterium]
MVPATEVLATLRALPVVPLPTLLGGEAPVLVLAPHPDDESLGCGGLIAECCARGQDVHVMILTDGRGSHPRSRAYPWPRLVDLRAKEAGRAAAVLGVGRERLTFLGIRDGAAPLFGRPLHRVAQQVEDYVRRHRIGTICTTWEHDPHRDHLAAFRAARLAAQRCATGLLCYPVWGWTLPDTAWLPAAPISGARIDVTPYLPAKASAIACHASQVSNLIPDDPTGYRIQPAFLALFSGPHEVFVRG